MKLTDTELTAIKSIPIADVMQWLGYNVRRTGNWVHVKGDDSLKAKISKNTYTDYSSKLGGGSVIDLVMQSQGCDFKTACEMLQGRFLGGVSVEITQKQPVKRIDTTAMKKYLDVDLVAKFLNKDLHQNNGFANFLQRRFDFVSDVLHKMNVGTNREGAAVFFYQNAKLQYEALKVVPYDSETGKRSAGINIPKGYQTQDGYVQNCFFNECAISTANTVFIVESEKTAVIATLYFKQSDFAFIATGGAAKLNALLDTKLPLLQDKRVVLLPDNDAAGNGWMDVKKLATENGYTNLELWWLDKESPEGSDLADFILGTDDNWKRTFDRMLNKGKQPEIQQPILQKPKIEIPDFDIPDFDIPSEPVKETPLQVANNQVKQVLQTVHLQANKPTESELYWAKRDAEKNGANNANMPKVDDLLAFFDKQILPETVQFFNADGYCYETLTNPNQFVTVTISHLKDAIAERNVKMATLNAYHLQRLKKVIETGAYLQRKIEDVPF